MRHGLKPEQLTQQPLAGCLFHIRVDVPGIAEPQFAG
jgi:sugar lactone lactonase YvrE